ncbi:MAG: hypothetical protein ACLTCB_06550 [Merdibacter sp.]
MKLQQGANIDLPGYGRTAPNGQEALAYSRHRKTASWERRDAKRRRPRSSAIINKLTSVRAQPTSTAS